MKFLGLLLTLVILTAILYQSVFTPAINQHVEVKTPAHQQAPALETLQQAQQLQQTLNSQPQEMDYKQQIKQH